MELTDVVKAIMGNAPLEDVQKHIDNILAVKAADAIDVRKVELASNLINTEEPNEVSGTESNVDGSADIADDAAVSTNDQ